MSPSTGVLAPCCTCASRSRQIRSRWHLVRAARSAFRRVGAAPRWVWSLARLAPLGAQPIHAWARVLAARGHASGHDSSVVAWSRSGDSKLQLFKHSHTRALASCGAQPSRQAGVRSWPAPRAARGPVRLVQLACQALVRQAPVPPSYRLVRWVGGMAEISRLHAVAGGDATFAHPPWRSPM